MLEQESIITLFNKQVLHNPDKIALVFEEHILSYSELDMIVNRLAGYIDFNFGANVLVSICLDPSIEMVCTIIAILKTGGTYLPIDPSYPLEVVNNILLNTRCLHGITSSSYKAKYFHNIDYKILNIDEIWHNSNNLKEFQFNHEDINLESSIHVLYTSGSTGNPKAVLNRQSSVLNRLNWMWNAYPFESTEVCALSTSINFIPSVWQIFGPLLKGIKLVIFSKQCVHNPEMLFKQIDQHQINRYMLVPSMLKLLVDYAKDNFYKATSVKLWIVSGEPLSRGLFTEYKNIFSESKLVVIYGSTEAEDVSVFDTDELNDHQKIPLGKAITGVKLYVLNTALNIVPVGGIGELYISGNGLATGYLNNPLLTAEKFIGNPFEPGSRIYKTGDLVKVLPNEVLEYIGREDFQVKINGRRLDLNQIEEALDKFNGITQSLVILKKNNSKQEEQLDQSYLIIGYYTAKANIDLDTLFTHLYTHLPEYMVPNHLVYLKDFPRLLNGKLDRKSLVAPNLSLVKYIAPQNEIESKITLIWSKILKLEVEKIGIRDHFFRLGGNSLSIIKLIVEFNKEFGIKIEISDIILNDTIEKLARSISYHIANSNLEGVDYAF